MCGICGVATQGAVPDQGLIDRMCATLVHRGPDGVGTHLAAGVGLGMRRLAIIDLVTGDQPVANEGGTVQAVFNGEIYNYRELRSALAARGHRLKSQGDSEVIPHLYEEHGIDFLEQLNGMFAIALWDVAARRLLLARDRAGIKPLFYSVRGGTLYFGSEIKAILAGGGSERRVNPHGLDQLLRFEYTASPTTLLTDVHKIPPGAWLTWTAGEMRSGSYWTLPASERSQSPDAWAEELRATFDAAVRRQLVSDVPLGAFLSGGVDSSILVGAMSRASDRPVRTFSIGFADASYNELPYARQVARRFGTDHCEAILEPRYLDMVEDVITHLDQPIADFSAFPTLLVSREARRHVTVVLSGDGGDELFAGYDTYLADRAAHALLDRLPAAVTRALLTLTRLVPASERKKGLRNNLERLLAGALFPPAWEHMRWMVFLSAAQARALYRPDMHAAVFGEVEAVIARYLDNAGADRLQRQLFCDTRFYLPEDILVKVDNMAMAASLETRVPYLDNAMLDLVPRMPSALKWRGRERKHILKRAYADTLPPEIRRREKQGFSIPLKSWLRREWNPLMRDVLSERAVRDAGCFEPAVVTRWMTEHEQGRANHSHILWALMVFQLWRARFLAGTP